MRFLNARRPVQYRMDNESQRVYDNRLSSGASIG
jgi:hypothetical protein